MRKEWLLGVIFFLKSTLGIAEETLSILSPLEVRVLQLSKKIRCLECPFQDIESSQGIFSSDLKQYLRNQLEEGKREEEVLEDLVEKYGDQILITPPLKGTTLFLWYTPFVFLTLALVVFLRKKDRRL